MIDEDPWMMRCYKGAIPKSNQNYRRGDRHVHGNSFNLTNIVQKPTVAEPSPIFVGAIFTAAVSDYGKVLELDPNHSKAFYGRALARLTLQKFRWVP